MSCPTTKRLCKRLVISQTVTFSNDTLIINIPAGNYLNGEKYCIIVAQNIPDTATINAPVVITIGDDTTTTYPLVNCDCTNVTACSINRRTRYSVCVHTDIATGVFKLLGKLPCSRCADNALSLPISTEAAPAGTPMVANIKRNGGDANA
jgi:hypothetical protein